MHAWEFARPLRSHILVHSRGCFRLRLSSLTSLPRMSLQPTVADPRLHPTKPPPEPHLQSHKHIPMPPSLSPCRAALLQCTHTPARRFPRAAFLASQRQRRAASTKHPKNFVPPTNDDLEELRERTIEFARREITPEVAQSTDHENEFPNSMWAEAGRCWIPGDDSR